MILSWPDSLVGVNLDAKRETPLGTNSEGLMVRLLVVVLNFSTSLRDAT
jgi:hypothetical protein